VRRVGKRRGRLRDPAENEEGRRDAGYLDDNATERDRHGALVGRRNHQTDFVMSGQESKVGRDVQLPAG
jgi:hypothetical protein